MWTNQWTIESSSKPGTQYKVSVDVLLNPPKWACDCPSGKYRGRCKHIEQAKRMVEAGRQAHEKVTNLNKLGIPPMPAEVPDSVLDDLL